MEGSHNGSPYLGSESHALPSPSLKMESTLSYLGFFDMGGISYFILLHSLLFYSILLCFILFCFILSVLFKSILTQDISKHCLIFGVVLQYFFVAQIFPTLAIIGSSFHWFLYPFDIYHYCWVLERNYSLFSCTMRYSRSTCIFHAPVLESATSPKSPSLCVF